MMMMMMIVPAVTIAPATSTCIISRRYNTSSGLASFIRFDAAFVTPELAFDGAAIAPMAAKCVTTKDSKKFECFITHQGGRVPDIEKNISLISLAFRKLPKVQMWGYGIRRRHHRSDATST